ARNRLFSVARDRAWRRRAAERADLHPGQTALDLCTGTGKLAHELLSFTRPGGRVVGIDFSEPMLERARKLEPEVEFRLGDAGRLSAGERHAYRYLAETVQGFPPPSELAAVLDRLGFAVTVEPLTFGIVVLHVAIRRG